MEKQKKISTTAGFIIIAVAIVILFGGAFAFQYFALKQAKTSVVSQKISVANRKQEILNKQFSLAGEPQNSPDQITDWKTYTDTLNGFEIQYPNNLVINSDGFGYQGDHFRYSQDEKSYKDSLVQCKSTAHPGVCADMAADDSSTLVFISSNELLNNSTSIGNFVVNSIIWKIYFPSYLDGSTKFYAYSASENNKFYTFYSPNDKLLEQILYTFKFTK